MSFQKAFDSHDPHLRLFLRYEELRRGSRRAFRSLVEFVDGQYSDQQLQQLMQDKRLEASPDSDRGPGHSRQTGYIAGYAAKFAADEVTLMSNIMRGGLKQYGYWSASYGANNSSMEPREPERERSYHYSVLGDAFDVADYSGALGQSLAEALRELRQKTQESLRLTSN
jgi:hypothetical protein